MMPKEEDVIVELGAGDALGRIKIISSSSSGNSA